MGVPKSRGRRMKIACFYSSDYEREYVQKHLKEHEIHFFLGNLFVHKDKIPHDIDALYIWTDSYITAPFIAQFPRLKLIATRSVGFDHIDLDAARKANICVCYAPHYARESVAEHVMGLMLMLSRKLFDACTRAHAGDISRQELCGFDLCGKTLGVIGTGDIGARVVELAHVFGVNILAFDVCQNKRLVDAGLCTYTTINELFGRSDIVTLHVPYNKATHHMINRENIKLFKRGCYLINTARGEVIESQALVQGLQEGIFAGLALDVFDGLVDLEHLESLILSACTDAQDYRRALANIYLMRHPRVIATPHNAFNTIQALDAALATTIGNIKNFCAGRPSNVVP